MNFTDDHDNTSATPTTSGIDLTPLAPTIAAPDAPDLPHYTCLVYTIVTNGVCQSVMYVIAAVGNVLGFVTWNRLGRTKGYNSSVILIQALAMSDLLTQMPLLYIWIIPNLLIYSGNFNNPFLITTNPYSSKYGWPIASVGNFGTVMITTLVTVHRYCVLSKPFSTFTRRLTSVPSTLIQITCIAVIGIAYSIPRFLSQDIVDKTLEDGSKIEVFVSSYLALRADYQLWYLTISYIVLVILLPLIISIVFTVLILLLLARARRNRKNMTSDARSKKESAITVILLTVVILFIVCQLPNTMVRVYLGFRPNTPIICGSVMFYVNSISILCVSLNSSINIFIYARSREFRNVLREMCCCGNGGDEKKKTVPTINSSLADSSSQLAAKTEGSPLSSSKITVAVVDSPI